MLPVDTTVLETYVVKSVTGFSGFDDVSDEFSADASEEVSEAVVLSAASEASEDAVLSADELFDELSVGCELQAVTAHIDNARSSVVIDFAFFIDRILSQIYSRRRLHKIVCRLPPVY